MGPSRSQAPGDADTTCTVTLAEQHPVYPSNIKVLMDSADYQYLIAGDFTPDPSSSNPDPVWLTVDVDNIDSQVYEVYVSWIVYNDHSSKKPSLQVVQKLYTQLYTFWYSYRWSTTMGLHLLNSSSIHLMYKLVN